jgi:hypothetical protein
MSKDIPQVGSAVRFGTWNGVVRDVFESPTSNKHIIQIMFAKNIYKRQPAELHILEDLGEELLVSSTKELLMEELARYNSSALAESEQLLATVLPDQSSTIESQSTT